MPVEQTPIETEALSSERSEVRGFRLEIVEGAPAWSFRSTGSRCTIGSHPTNDVVVDDPTVSRFHCELTSHAGTVHVRDLGSRNGTLLDGVRIALAEPRDGSVLRLGRAAIRFALVENQAIRLSARREFGGLVGESVALRAAFAIAERAAASDATVLLEGETGTGKGALAEAIHSESPRRDQPFVVVDCGALTPSLLESELFGHEKGAFTGAHARRIGAFEEADGGTLFLDEIGELPADLQPKLLRVLENREVRRIGQNARQKVDFRLIAATNRDLRAEVNAGRFRADLYYRLAVVTIEVPALRRRREDIPALTRAILASLRATPAELAALTAPDVLARLADSAWPGNVRELRNYLERSRVLHVDVDAHGETLIANHDALIDERIPTTRIASGSGEHAPLAHASAPAASDMSASPRAPSTNAAARSSSPATNADAPASTNADGTTSTSSDAPASAANARRIDPHASYADARRSALDAFERDYAAAVLHAHDGNVAAAARSAGIARYSFYRLLHRHGLTR